MGDASWEELVRGWGTAVDLPLREALGRWLDQMETHIDLSDRPDPPRRTRIGTGLPSLNRVLSGGLRARGVTTIECDSPQIADALVTTVARRIGVPTLLAGTDLQGLTTQLIAGEAAVSRRDASRGTLDEDDWTRIAAAVGKLAERRVHLSAASTLGGVREAILERPETTVVLVLRPERLGAIDLVLRAFTGIAKVDDVAVLIATRPVREPMLDLPRLRRIGIVRSDHEHRHTLLRLDRDTVVTTDIRFDPDGASAG